MTDLLGGDALAPVTDLLGGDLLGGDATSSLIDLVSGDSLAPVTDLLGAGPVTELLDVALSVVEQAVEVVGAVLEPVTGLLESIVTPISSTGQTDGSASDGLLGGLLG